MVILLGNDIQFGTSLVNILPTDAIFLFLQDIYE